MLWWVIMDARHVKWMCVSGGSDCYLIRRWFWNDENFGNCEEILKIFVCKIGKMFANFDLRRNRPMTTFSWKIWVATLIGGRWRRVNRGKWEWKRCWYSHQIIWNVKDNSSKCGGSSDWKFTGISQLFLRFLSKSHYSSMWTWVLSSIHGEIIEYTLCTHQMHAEWALIIDVDE